MHLNKNKNNKDVEGEVRRETDGDARESVAIGGDQHTQGVLTRSGRVAAALVETINLPMVLLQRRQELELRSDKRKRGKGETKTESEPEPESRAFARSSLCKYSPPSSYHGGETEDPQTRVTRWARDILGPLPTSSPSEVSVANTTDIEEDVYDAEGEMAIEGTEPRQIRKTKRVRKSPGAGNDKRGTVSVETIDLSEGELPPQEKKGRGRPAVTGDGIQIEKRRQIAQAVREQKEQIDLMESILQGGYDPTRYAGTKYKRLEEEKRVELEEAPITFVAAECHKLAHRIDEIAAKSKSIKGTFVRELREASVFLHVGVDKMTGKLLADEREREMERLREEMALMKKEKEETARGFAEEIALLKREVGEMREERDRALMGPPSSRAKRRAPPSPPPPPPSPSLTGELDDLLGMVQGMENFSPPPRSPPKKVHRSEAPGPSVYKKKKKKGGADDGVSPVTRVAEGKNEVAQRLDRLEEMMRAIAESIAKLETGSVVRGKTLSGDRARESAPTAVPPRGTTGERPVPGTGKGGEGRKGRGGKKADRRPPQTPPSHPTPPKKLPPKGGAVKGVVSALTAEKAITPLKEVGWNKVLGRKERRGAREAAAAAAAAAAAPPSSAAARPPQGQLKGERKGRPAPKRGSPPQPPQGGGKRAPRRRAPRTSAILLTCPTGQYREVMEEARRKIALAEVGLEGLRPRTSVTGAMILEIPGPDHGAKADALAARMREALRDREGVRISRPVKTAELRVLDLEASNTAEEVVEAVAKAGGCEAHEIRAGVMRQASRGQGSIWLASP